ARLVTGGLPTLVWLAILAAGCDSGAKPTSAGLVTSARTYWTDLSLRTDGTLAAAYGYLSPNEQTHCSEHEWQRGFNTTNRFSDVQVSDPEVTRDGGRVRG